jgi:hypothetical protein
MTDLVQAPRGNIVKGADRKAPSRAMGCGASAIARFIPARRRGGWRADERESLAHVPPLVLSDWVVHSLGWRTRYAANARRSPSISRTQATTESSNSRPLGCSNWRYSGTPYSLGLFSSNCDFASPRSRVHPIFGLFGRRGGLGEQRQLGVLVAGHEAPIVPLDHCQRRAAVLGQVRVIHTVRERQRDERVAGRVELSQAHARSARRQ